MEVAHPTSTAEVAEVLRDAAARRMTVVAQGRNTKPDWGLPVLPDLVVDVSGMDRVLDHQAGDEEGAPDPVALEQIEHAPAADLPAIGALRHDDRTLRVLRVARGPERLAVQVEAQHHRQAVAGHGHGAARSFT